MHVTEEDGFSVRLLQLAEDRIRITHLALAMYPCSGFPPFFCPISFVLKTQKGPHNSRASFQSWQYCYWNPEQFEFTGSPTEDTASCYPLPTRLHSSIYTANSWHMSPGKGGAGGCCLPRIWGRVRSRE